MLYFEYYPFSKPLTPLTFFTYKVDVIEPKDAAMKSVLNSAVRYLNRSAGYGKGYYACADDTLLYTRREIEEGDLTRDYQGVGKTYIYRLIPQGKEVLSFTHAEIYESYLKQRSLKKLLLRQVPCSKNGGMERFYFLQDNKLISKFLYDYRNKHWVEKVSREGVRLLRQYDFSFRVLPDGHGYLCLDTRSQYESTFTIYDILKKNQGRKNSVVNTEVNFDCPLSFPMSGTLTDAAAVKNEKFRNSTTETLRDYYQKKYGKNPSRVSKFLKAIPEDDCVVYLKPHHKDEAFPVFASLVRPVMDTAYVASIDSSFSREAGVYTKRNMNRRIILDHCFIQDLGELPDTDGVEIIFHPVSAEELHYEAGCMPKPYLIAGNDVEFPAEQKEKNKIFRANVGYYRRARIIDKCLRIGILYTGDFDYTQFMKRLGPFLAMKKSYKPCRMPILDNSTDFSRFLRAIRNQNFDVLIMVLPNKNYARFDVYDLTKTKLSLLGVPSQMVQLRTAQKIIGGDEYSIQNVVMGCLGKLGAIPYVLRDMPGEVDLFVGLDVGMYRAGTHYPGCSVCVDAHGKLIGCYQPLLPQSGEKIEDATLERIFDEVLAAFEKEYGRRVKNIVVHRDGFSNERLEWYEEYFRRNNIRYTLVEIRKSGAPRLADNGIVGNNPLIGSVVYPNDQEAILVTTEPYKGMGAPHPLKIIKVAGELDIKTIAQQIYFLTKIHVGAKQNIRLPITTYYADKICKNLTYFPKDQFVYQLYFL